MRLHTWLEDDPDRWNAFVESAAYRSFSQLWEWGELRREGGWTPLRLAVGDPQTDGGILAGAASPSTPSPICPSVSLPQQSTVPSRLCAQVVECINEPIEVWPFFEMPGA